MSESAPTTKYLSADELAEIMKSDKVPGKDFIVVDVRDDDYPGGHIKGSLHKPSRTFLKIVHDLVKDTKDVPLVIFYSALSDGQSRCLKAARVYDETRQEALKNDETRKDEAAVLRGGFTQFQAKFKDDPTLVENEWSGPGVDNINDS